MKKRLMVAVLAGMLGLTAVNPVTALADSQKVVTLGADLSDDQKNALMQYFGVSGQNVQIITVTNADERAHLGAYVPIEQIGTRTFSSALVNPTTSGGIQVRTANLVWVTGNMIASTLSTCGVKNCEVLAASPFEVSGTGALTGIIMAYESAAGVTLDTTKKELATEELVTTGTIADQVGQNDATNIVNEIKIQVIEGQVQEQDTQVIESIVNEVVQEVTAASSDNTVTLSEEDKQLLIDLATKIAEQEYRYEDVKETLERVENNVSDLTEAVNNLPAETEAAVVETPAASETPADSIFNNMDGGALGENVVQTTTDTQETVEQTEEIPAEQPEQQIAETPAEQPEQIAETPAEQPEQTVETPAEQPEQSVETPAEEIVVDQPEIVETPVDQPEQTVEEPVEEPEPLVIGEVKIYPEETDDYGEDINATGLNTVRIDVQNAGIAVVSGTLVIKDSFGNEIKRVDLADNQNVLAETATSDVTFLNNWTEGTSIYVNVGTALAVLTDDKYDVYVDAVVARSETPDVQAQLSASGKLCMKDRGVTFNVDSVNTLTVGNTVTGSIMMDTDQYASAEIIGTTGRLVIDNLFFSPEALTFNATVNACGTEELKVLFTLYDESTVESTFYIPIG